MKRPTILVDSWQDRRLLLGSRHAKAIHIALLDATILFTDSDRPLGSRV